MVGDYDDAVRRVYLVCERQKWCYLSIQKIAGTSIRLAFLKHVGAPHQKGGNLRDDIEPWQLTQNEVLRRQDLHRWAFVRDPRQRLISCYKNKIASDKPDPYCSWRVNKYYGWRFDDFIQAVCELPDKEMDQHFAPMKLFLTYRGLPLYDEFFHFEDIQEKWPILQQLYGLPDLGHTNPTKKSVWREHYNNKTEQLVLDRYADDFNLFGYGK